MEKSQSKPIYSVCKHIKNIVLENALDDEFICSEARVPGLPLFEAERRNFKQTKYYSLATNDQMRCRWGELQSSIERPPKTPHIFPNTQNIRFHNCSLQLVLPTSVKPDFRFRMRNGPGSDSIGPLPIPNDMQLRASLAKNRKLPKTREMFVNTKP